MELTRKKKVGIVAIVVLVAFGISQCVAATDIAIGVTSSKLVSTSSDGTMYELEVKVSNPTVFPITVGQTTFDVSKDAKAIGSGVLESFVMPIMGNTIVRGTYLVDSDASQDDSNVRISGTIEYQLLFGSISLPFEYDTADGFIHRT